MIYDMTTSNESFINMRMFLKKQKIINNAFFLTLLDEDLIGINPRDPNLTDVQKRKIIAECKNNYWYFLREIVRIPDIGTDEGVSYPLNRGTLAFNFCLENDFSAMVDLPTQVNKYLTMDIRLLWEYLMRDNSKAVIFDNNYGDALKHLNFIIKSSYRLLPDYLKIKDICEDKTKYIRSGGSVINIGKKAKTNIEAENIGGSLTHNRQVFCDFSNLKYNEKIFSSSRQPYSISSKNAFKDGIPFGTIVLTNGGNISTKPGKFAYTVKELSQKFDESFYDWDIEHLKDLGNRSCHPMFYITFNLLDLQKSYDWITQRIKLMNYNWTEFMRDGFTTWI